MYSTCQRCAGKKNDAWNIKQAELHIGSVQNWKVQLCQECTLHVEQAVLAALRPPTEGDGKR